MPLDCLDRTVAGPGDGGLIGPEKPGHLKDLPLEFRQGIDGLKEARPPVVGNRAGQNVLSILDLQASVVSDDVRAGMGERIAARPIVPESIDDHLPELQGREGEQMPF